MQIIKLKDLIRIIKPYSGKSKFEIWNSMDVGDILEISVELEKNTGATNGIYVPTIRIFNKTKEISGGESWNAFVNKLNKVEFEQYKN